MSNGFKTALIIPDVHCVPIESELLTKKGWVQLKDYNSNDEILIADQDFNLFFEKPKNTILKQNKEEVFKFVRGNLTFESTSEHRNILTYKERYDTIFKTRSYIRKTKDILDKPVSMACTGFLSIDKDKYTDFDMYMLGFIIGDGTRDTDNWKIAIKKQRKISIIDSIFDKELLTRNKNKDYIVYRLRSKFTKFIDFFINKNKEVDLEKIICLSNRNKLFLLKGICDSDGSIKKDRQNITISSVRQNHIDVVQILAHTIGLMAIRAKNIDNSKSTFPSKKPLLNIVLSTNGAKGYSGKYTTTKEFKMVGCVTVSTGMFFVRQNNNIFITGNCPEQDQKALDLIYDIAKDEKLDRVIQLGDLSDFYQVSRYSKNPARAYGDKLQEELDVAEKFVERFTNLAPVTILESNHGDRLEKYLKEKAPGLFGLRALSMKNLLNLNKYGAQMSGPLFLGQLLVMHGHEYNFSANGAGTTVKKIVEKTGNSIMIGHVHKLASIHVQKRAFSAEGYEMGCVCNFDNDYCLDPDWALGFGFVNYRDNGDKSFHVEQVKIERCGKGLKNRKAFFRGKVYEL